MKIVIVDDNKIMLSDNKKKVVDVCRELDIDCDISSYSSFGKLLFKHIKENEIDVAILDIEIGYANGIVVSKIIKENNRKCFIIFVTSHEKYLYVANDVQPMGFLSKPIDINKLKNIFIQLCCAYSNDGNESSCQEYLKISDKNQYIKMPLIDIVYMKLVEKMVVINTTQDEKILLKKYSLTELQELLPHNLFIRSGRDIISNVQHIQKVEKTKITLDNGEILYSSMKKSKDVKIRLEEYRSEKGHNT